MKVCMIMSNPLPPKEGIGTYVSNLSKQLVETGEEVSIITRGSFKNAIDDIYGIEVFKPIFIPVFPFHVHIHGFYLNKLLKSIEEQFDIIHAHSPLIPFLKTSLPIITTIHTPMLIDNQKLEISGLNSELARITGKYISYPLEKKLLKESSLITTVSSSVANELKYYGIKKDNIRVIRNGVDEKTFYPLKKQLNSYPDYLFYSGRLGYRKGLLDLIKSAKYVINEFPDLIFIIAGEGPLKKNLQNKIVEYGVSKNFKLLGHIDKDKIVSLYQNATIHLIPSHYEGLPTSLLEAMSCGLPVIATAVSGNVELIKSGENGILIPPKSPEILSKEIINLLKDDDLRNKLGTNARKTIKKNYTWHSITENIKDCYNMVLGN